MRRRTGQLRFGATVLALSSLVITPTPVAAGEPLAASPFYRTNPAGQVGKSARITVDGNPSEWSEELIVAQGVANDDPRIFRGSHEAPVMDLYSLSAAWDQRNLYLMWQITNVTDVVDPSQKYPISDNGKPYAVDLPMTIALDADPGKGTDGLIAGSRESVWELRTRFTKSAVDHLANFSSKPGLGEPALFTQNTAGKFDYKKENVHPFDEIGVRYEHSDALTTDEVTGIDATGNAGYVPADLARQGDYENLLEKKHDPAQDTVYEINIPLAELGLTAEKLESRGLGVLLIMTFGQSGTESLPHDPAVLNNATEPYSADPSTSKEKEDYDAFSVRFARVGRL